MDQPDVPSIKELPRQVKTADGHSSDPPSNGSTWSNPIDGGIVHRFPSTRPFSSNTMLGRTLGRDPPPKGTSSSYSTKFGCRRPGGPIDGPQRDKARTTKKSSKATKSIDLAVGFATSARDPYNLPSAPLRVPTFPITVKLIDFGLSRRHKRGRGPHDQLRRHRVLHGPQISARQVCRAEIRHSTAMPDPDIFEAIKRGGGVQMFHRWRGPIRATRPKTS